MVWRRCGKPSGGDQELFYIRTVWGKGYRFEGEREKKEFIVCGMDMASFCGRRSQPAVFYVGQIRDGGVDLQMLYGSERDALL